MNIPESLVKRIPLVPTFAATLLTAAAIVITYPLWEKFYPYPHHVMILLFIVLAGFCGLFFWMVGDTANMIQSDLNMRKRYKTLTKNEKLLLHEFVVKCSERSLLEDISNPTVAKLLHDGILEKVSEHPSDDASLGGNGRTTFAVALKEKEWRWLNMAKNRKLLEIADNQSGAAPASEK
jgi:hypothetical protein